MANPKRFSRSKIRLQGYDYSAHGYYFITICTAKRSHFFGWVKQGKMTLSEMGYIAQEEWLKTPLIRPDSNISLDAYCVMPNHFHGIICFGTPCLSDAYGRFPRTDGPNARFGPQRKSLGSLIRGYKGAVSSRIWKNGRKDFAWQPRFHDRIVRDMEELYRIRLYIQNNPARWAEDEFYGE